MTGYNWRNTLSDQAATSGILAGFSVSLIALIVGGSIADILIPSTEITFGQLAVLFFGLSTGLFVAGSELFLRAKTYDIYNIPEKYFDKIEQDKNRDKDWKQKHINQSRKDFKHGRLCFNTSVFILFVGIFFTVTTYNFFIALIVSGFGITLEIWQILR